MSIDQIKQNIYKLFDKIGIPLQGKTGKRNIIVFSSLYLFIFLIILISPKENIPSILIYVAILFPIVFVGISLILLMIKSIFTYLYKRLSIQVFSLLSFIIFILWNVLLAFGIQKMQHLGNWHGLPLMFLPITVMLIVCGYFCYHIISYWYFNLKSYKDLFRFLLIHFILYIPVLLVLLADKLYNIFTSDLGFTITQLVLLLTFIQYLIYCMMSFSVLLRRLIRIIK